MRGAAFLFALYVSCGAVTAWARNGEGCARRLQGPSAALERFLGSRLADRWRESKSPAYQELIQKISECEVRPYGCAVLIEDPELRLYGLLRLDGERLELRLPLIAVPELVDEKASKKDPGAGYGRRPASLNLTLVRAMGAVWEGLRRLQARQPQLRTLTLVADHVVNDDLKSLLERLGFTRSGVSRWELTLSLP